jgi:carboxyl-terminal processing protease
VSHLTCALAPRCFPQPTHVECRDVQARLIDVARIRRLLVLLVTSGAFTSGACSGTAPATAPEPASPASPGATAAVDPPSPAVPANPNVDPRERELCEITLQTFESEHLLHRRIDAAVSRSAFETYIDRLDHNKLFLLKTDRNALAKYADKIGDELRAGSLDLAHDTEKLFARRVDIVDKMVAELLASPFDLTRDETVETDPKKLDFVDSDQDLRERWRQRLELEVLERLATMEQALHPDPAVKPPKGHGDAEKQAPPPPPTDIPATDEARQAKARGELAKSYAGRFARLMHPEKLGSVSDVINAIAAAYDPHTDYLPPNEEANFNIQMSGALEGIGAVLREKDHLIEISELVPGGASWRQGGLAPNDLILSVQQADGKDPVDVTDMRIDDVVKMIRGPKGTVVRLRIQKPTGTQDTVAITRDVVVIEEAYARGAILSRKGESIGYIHLPSFYGGQGSPRNAAKDVNKLLAEMQKRKVAGVVLDIRSNGGGLLSAAVEMTGGLIDKGPVVQVRDSHDKGEVLGDDDRGTFYDGPVVVMVDKFSASASEILAAALQDYHRAVIVGTTTHGKGTVQTIADLDRMFGTNDDLGEMKFTIQQFFRVDGPSTQLDGVTPDVVLPDPAGYVDTRERTLEHALPASKIAAVAHELWPAKWKLDVLANKSLARVAKQPVLSKIAAATEVLRARVADTKVPLQHDAWMTRRKQERAEYDAVSPDFDKNTASFQITPIGEAADAPPPGPGAKTDDRIAKWSASVARDPWIEESVNVLDDMH